MTNCRHLVCFIVLCGIITARAAEVDPAQLPPAVERKIDFGVDILPLLRSHCFDCHQGRNATAGYRLDLRAEILGETNGEPLAISGKSARSKLVHLVSGLGKRRMPPKDEGEQLSTEQVGTLRAWIDQGLPWDEKRLPPTDLNSSHWAFRRIERPALPQGASADWIRTPVDSFISAHHETKGLSPSPSADRRTLLRRASLDLTGLPPTPSEIRAFVDDTSPDAYERLVERLLASPRHGERWGRHWLDVARFAESEGYESNHSRPYAWRYRDYVVSSFNRDKPFGRFLREQIAGDELSPYTDENLIATGFLAAARLSSNEEDKVLQRNSVLVDITNAVGSGVLGLTLGCAQCHNHKFDPLSQRDYYRLQALFVRGQPNNLALRDEAAWQAYQAAKPPEYDWATQLRQSIYDRAKAGLLAERRKKLTPEMSAALNVPEAKRTPHEQELARQADLELQILVSQVEKAILGDDRALYDALKKKVESLEKTLPDKPQTWGYYSPASPTSVDILPMKGFYPLVAKPAELREARAYLLVRGNEHRRGPQVEPGWPAVFGSTTSSATDPYQGSRSMFVDWLVSRENPLTARVWVNRIWQQHFGRGLVATPDDFGLQGVAPTHPELLDYLACELIESGWSTKHVHRLIMLSSTYRQSIPTRSTSEEKPSPDPDNLYLARWSPRRLEAETLRDSFLAVSGELDWTVGGKSTADDSSTRRSIYLLQKRDAPPEMQRVFDGPSANESCARRNVSTVALQPLYLLNSPVMQRRAAAFSQRVSELAGNDPLRQIETAYEFALGRLPEREEISAGREYLTAHSSDALARNRLAEFCLALLNLNEFAYLR